ncbi:MAG: hypothetical protein ACTIJ9_16675 [Aequorivita sp.]
MSNQNFKNFFIEKANDLLQKREKMPFEIDANNKFALNFFISYFSDINALEKLGGKFHKGILFYGNCGTGKSLFFEILEEVYKQHQHPHFRIKTVNTIELTDRVIGELSRPNQLAPNDKSIYQRNITGSIHFEDLGAERKLNHFGNSIEFMSDIIQLRYAKSRRSICKTFITTNLSLDEIQNRYGERFYDRMFEMFNLIQVSGKTRRK